MEIENPELEPEFVGYHLPLLKEMLLRTLSAAQGKPIEVQRQSRYAGILSVSTLLKAKHRSWPTIRTETLMRCLRRLLVTPAPHRVRKIL